MYVEYHNFYEHFTLCTFDLDLFVLSSVHMFLADICDVLDLFLLEFTIFANCTLASYAAFLWQI